MLENELEELIAKIQKQKCESRVLEVKAAHGGCPQRLYDTFSSFSNHNDGGTIVFGLDEKADDARTGVYDPQDLQKKLMEVGEQMTPVIRPVLTVSGDDSNFCVAAEIPPTEISERPCFRTSAGRLKGSYIRVGDADKPMSEYEVYQYDAYRKRIHEDMRPLDVDVSALDPDLVLDFLRNSTRNRPNLSQTPQEQLFELLAVKNKGRITLMALLLLGVFPQAQYPQLAIIASRVPGIEMGVLDTAGNRFTDSRRIEGTLPEMLEGAMHFVESNMRRAIRIDPRTGQRGDVPEYPADAVREAVLNALVHRDYSIRTEGKPIQIIVYTDRIEIRSPGGLYGSTTVEQLGSTQPDTRNQAIIRGMETIKCTENRYSGIPRIRRAMRDAGLPEPAFLDNRDEFVVCLYNNDSPSPCEMDSLSDSPIIQTVESTENQVAARGTPEELLNFCAVPRTRSEISAFLGRTRAYVSRRFIQPLVQEGKLVLSIPEKPQSSRQTYRTAQSILADNLYDQHRPLSDAGNPSN